MNKDYEVRTIRLDVEVFVRKAATREQAAAALAEQILQLHPYDFTVLAVEADVEGDDIRDAALAEIVSTYIRQGLLITEHHANIEGRK
jgi:hypothetical protein